MNENLSEIEVAHQNLVTHFLEAGDDVSVPAGLVTAIAIGTSLEEEPVENAPEFLTIFLDTAASSCEEQDILKEATPLAKSLHLLVLRCGPFEGLQVVRGQTVAPFDRSCYNIPLIAGGTLGLVAVTDPGGVQYVVSSNHVLSHNGRTSNTSPICSPGPLENANGAAPIAENTDCVSLMAPPWPLRGRTAVRNPADCGWAKVTANIGPLPPEVTAPPAPIPAGTKVSKLGRTTGQTNSRIRFRSWCGFVGFNFGTYYLVNQLATYSHSPTNPFAEAGDSGSAVIETGSTICVGLVCARGYRYRRTGEYRGCIILISPMEVVQQEMAAKLGPLKFFGYQ